MQNIKATKEYFLKAVSSVINGTALENLPPDVNDRDLYYLAKKNSVQAILYYANEKNNFASEEVKSVLEKSYRTSIIREMNQKAMIESLRRKFTNAEISFMLLKGSHLKALYPSEEMRFMVDTDILVHERDIEKAKKIILNEGLELKMNNGKDLVFIKKPFLTVELHKSLFVEDYYMFDYFKSVWERAEKASEYEYKMSENDLYIYTLAHLAEHYTSGGSCFRPMIDIYLLNRKCSEKLNSEYIYSELEKLKILDFSKNIEKLGRCIFDGEEKNETVDLVEKFVVLGPPVQNASEAKNANRSKASRILSSAFPKYKTMVLLYPILKKLPFLLPFMWLIRIVTHLAKKDTKAKLESITSVDNSDYERLKRIYEKSGIEKF